VTKKLTDYVTMPVFLEMETENKVVLNRQDGITVTLREVEKLGKDNVERHEASRKRIQRLSGELEALKRKTASALDITTQ